MNTFTEQQVLVNVIVMQILLGLAKVWEKPRKLPMKTDEFVWALLAHVVTDW